MTAARGNKADESKVQRRKDGACMIGIPAGVRDMAEMEGGFRIRWTPASTGRPIRRWEVEVLPPEAEEI